MPTSSHRTFSRLHAASNQEKTMSILYTATATSTGGRDGRAVSSDEQLDVKLSAPKALGGTGAEGTNPEQLFAAGYSACFLSAMKFVAGQQKTALPADTTVSADVGVGPNDNGGFALDIELRVSLPGIPADQAQKLVDTAHQVCPYSNATRNNVPVRVKIV
jgi:Ohr subfamily peroxiredoxin